MVRPCDNCIFYRKEEDEFRQQFVDMIVLDSNAPEPHFCPMYDDQIPDGIYYKGESCDLYIEK